MGSGSANSMITILKNNKNMLSKKKGLSSMSDYKKKSVEFKVEKASPILLKRIGRRVKDQQKDLDLKIWTVLILIMSVIISVFLYYF